MKTVLVACGSGVATSQTVASRVNKMFKERNIEAKVEAIDMKSLERLVKNCDAFITIAKAEKDYGVPFVSGIPFLTGVGIESEFQKLLQILSI